MQNTIDHKHVTFFEILHVRFVSFYYFQAEERITSLPEMHHMLVTFHPYILSLMQFCAIVVLETTISIDCKHSHSHTFPPSQKSPFGNISSVLPDFPYIFLSVRHRRRYSHSIYYALCTFSFANNKTCFVYTILHENQPNLT